ncbi:hypothetical protein [Arthrobacter sp. GMC3]|uniref:hypothetical protein n=1 Tax=Arthrobacter sp. GMC3 TaxID=2058894 RepID=UPI000CE3EF25|nr:hypothetical protein [Arthrobacter sp. GMC3]
MTYPTALLVASQLIQAVDNNIDSTVSITPSNVEFCIWTGGYGPQFDNHAMLIEEAAKFLDTRHVNIDQRFWRSGNKGHHTVNRDMATLSGTISKIAVKIHYLVPHIHGRWLGIVENDQPRWTCGRCRERITITESRKLGLLPPLDRRKS